MTHHRHKNNGGYVGLLALLIVTMIIVFMMAKEFQTYGITQVAPGVGTTTAGGSPVGSSASGGINAMAPIQQAQNAKNIMEEQDQNTSEQER